MERAIAVVEATESAKDLVREAGELAAGVDAELLLVYGITEREYAESRESMASISDFDVNYTVDEAVDGAAKFAENIGREVLADVDVEYETVPRLGEKADEVLAVAEERDADHVFMAGRKRSPTGKALFGDDTQRVILEFDGAVTVLTS